MKPEPGADVRPVADIETDFGQRTGRELGRGLFPQVLRSIRQHQHKLVHSRIVTNDHQTFRLRRGVPDKFNEPLGLGKVDSLLLDLFERGAEAFLHPRKGFARSRGRA